MAPETLEKEVAITPQMLRWLWRGISMFITSPVGGKAKAWLAILLALMLCINGMNVINSYVLRNFMTAIQARDSNLFVYYAWIYGGVFAISTIVAVFFRFAEERLGLLWRNWMTHRLSGLYIDGRIYLHLQADGSLTNPDQRITEDVKGLTVTTLSFVLMILNSSITAISFSGVLWNISPTLFVVAVIYAAAGSGLTILLGRPLIRLNYRQEDFEADFRSELVRVREFSEGIALTGYEGRIRHRLMERIDNLIYNFRRIISVNRNLGFFTTGYNYMIQLIPLLIVAPLFIRDDVQFGVIGQSAMAFATLVGAFSLIITQFQQISTYASVVARLGEFVEAADRAANRNAAACIGCSTVSGDFAFRDLTLRSTDGEERVLIDKLTATLPVGKRILIAGDGGAAKQALFRAAAGLYEAGSGYIERPKDEKLVFLPENPFLPPGTLRELLVSTENDTLTTDEDVSRTLREVGLNAVVAKHDGAKRARNWQNLIQLEDQQLMAVARAILARPNFAFLNHLNSALTEETEKRILKLMAKHGITCVSFSDERPDPSLHDASLELHEDGSWKWTDLW